MSGLPAGFEGLRALVRILRSEEGCPWDREQTPGKIKTYLLEEAYELVESIESGDSREVCGELGDLLFHIVFLARLYEESGDFTMDDVVAAITGKMVRRHPHVFGHARVSGPEEVKKRWLEIKKAEAKEQGDKGKSPFESVPRQLPALMRAYRIAERAAKLGLYRRDADRFLDSLERSVAQVRAAVQKEGRNLDAAAALGDVLFAVVNVSRSLDIHPETTLIQEVRRFETRCERMAEILKKKGLSSESADAGEIAGAWRAAGRE